MYQRLFILALSLGWLSSAGILPAQTIGKSVVILANENSPDSIALAEYYAEKRRVPLANICLLDLPLGEDISRSQYESRLREPLLEFLRNGDFIRQDQRKREPSLLDRIQIRLDRWRGRASDASSQGGAVYWETQESSVNFLVPIYGVPLRISNIKDTVSARVSDHRENIRNKTIAAVDSELALCLAGSYAKEGSFRNPVYNAVTWSEVGSVGDRVTICSRLDAPTPDMVRRMIDESLQAERYGIQGRAVVDARGVRTPGHFTGDFWLRSAHDRLGLEGYDRVMDSNEELVPEEYPLEEVAVYFGWYAEHASGALARNDFRFAPGAVACHIHSASASTLRSEEKNWVGPLLAHGAAATMGAVHEPYLRLTVDLDIFADRLCSGYSFGESAYMAMPALSWQMTVIGDPLYRPFRFTVDEQIAHMEEDQYPRLEWGYTRKVLQLVRDGYFNLALDYARRKLQDRDSLVLRELLADLYLKNNLLADASAEYKYILQNTQSEATSIRVGKGWATVLKLSGDAERAEKVLADLQRRWPNSRMRDWLKREPQLP